MPLAQTIGLETLSKYFHLPINDVAKELGVCATVLKKICRKNGIPRWPHRKIKSLDKMITTLEASVAKNPEDGERIRHEIHTLKNKKMFLMKNPNVLATKAPNMKKGTKAAQKSSGNKSPADSPESPSNHNDQSHPPFHSFNYPSYPTYNEASYPNNIYNSYNSYNTKNNPTAFQYYPYPSHYHVDSGEPRRLFDSEECLSPSMVLDPVAAALFLQIPHPHIPHTSTISKTIDSPPSEKSQWVPGDHPSAFTPKSVQNKLSPTSQSQPAFLQELFDDQARMVPQHSPSHSQQLHSNSNYLIQLPELRLPDEKDKPKLSTLEPDLFHHGEATPKEIAPPATLSPSSKWQLPEWFEAEHQQLMRKDQPTKGHELVYQQDTSPYATKQVLLDSLASKGARDELCVPMDDQLSSGDRTPPLSVGE